MLKYDAVLNGLAAVEGMPGARADVRVTLALGSGLTPAARRIANTLGVTVVEHVVV